MRVDLGPPAGFSATPTESARQRRKTNLRQRRRFRISCRKPRRARSPAASLARLAIVDTQLERVTKERSDGCEGLSRGSRRMALRSRRENATRKKRQASCLHLPSLHHADYQVLGSSGGRPPPKPYSSEMRRAADALPLRPAVAPATGAKSACTLRVEFAADGKRGASEPCCPCSGARGEEGERAEGLTPPSRTSQNWKRQVAA